MSSLWCRVIVLWLGGAVAAPSSIVTIKLDKQYVPVLRNEVVVSHKTAFFGKVFVGSPPQHFSVIFDTGSGHFFLPSSTCRSETCRGHRQFDPRTSTSAQHIDHNGAKVLRGSRERDQVAVTYGTGKVEGAFVRETVCLGSSNNSTAGCAPMRVILASEMTEEPFNSFEFDGVLGLGLESLAVDPEFSFFEQLSKQHDLKALFGYFVSKSDAVPSEISFGGHDARRTAHELSWAPVHRPELGYWQVEVEHVYVAGEPLPFCEEGGCVAIADTGTSLLGVPKQASQRLHWLLARKVPSDQEEDLDCRDSPGPEIVFVLKGGVRLSLGPEDYSRPAAMKVMQAKTQTAQIVCRATLLPVEENSPLGAKAWILGEPVLKKYYTAYDWRNKQVGFALSVQPEAEEVPSHTIYGTPPELKPKAAEVHV